MPPRPGGDCLVHVSSVGGDTGGGARGAAQGNVHGGAPDNIFIRHKIIFSRHLPGGFPVGGCGLLGQGGRQGDGEDCQEQHRVSETGKYIQCMKKIFRQA